jgi:hypothetical protein
MISAQDSQSWTPIVPGISFMPGTNMPAPELMTAEEAAQYLRLDAGRDLRQGVAALLLLVKEQKVRPTKGIGKANRFSRAELDRFIRASTPSPGSAQRHGRIDAEEDEERGEGAGHGETEAADAT